MRISDWSSDVCSSDLHQPSARLAHRLKPFEPQLQSEREFLGARLLLGIARQQQRRFEEREPGRHHQIIGREFELEPRRLLDEIEILLDEIEDRKLSQIRSEEHTSELQSLMRISYAVFCLKKKK